MNQLLFTPAHQLAQMIRERTLSSVELLDAQLIQIDKHNSKLNAICIEKGDVMGQICFINEIFGVTA